MQVKVFEGFSMKDVMKSVKETFGKDAVILSSREKTVEGTTAKMIEVKVAAADAPKVHGASAINPSERWVTQEEMLPHFTQIERRFQILEEKVASKDQLQRLESGIKDLSQLLNFFLQDKVDPNVKKLPSFVQNLYHQLVVTGLHKASLIAMLKHLRSLPAFNHDEHRDFQNAEDYYKALAIRYFLPKIKIAPPIKVIEGISSIHCFVGPEGAGKTSAIAKLSSLLRKSINANVLLVNYDQKSAVTSDSLRVFAKIANIPYLSVQSAKELKSYLAKNSQIHVALIDTLGCVPRSASLMAEFHSLTNSEIPIDIHLVLSLTERFEQLDAALRTFAPLGLASLMFTKLDESLSFGDIVNLSEKWSLPISYFSTGKKIPDDFERASRERVIERIMGL